MKSSVLAAELETSPSFGSATTMDAEAMAAPNGEAYFPTQETEQVSISIPPHPFGVKPLGNQYTATRSAKDNLGRFQKFPDEVLILLLEYLDGPLLRSLGSTCKALFAFTRVEDLWKTLFIEW
jgi:hypothetical protein